MLNTGVSYARAVLIGSPTVLPHGRVTPLCCFGRLDLGHIARPWCFIVACVGKILSLLSHSLKHAHVLGRVFVETPVFKICISKLGVKYQNLKKLILLVLGLPPEKRLFIV